MDSVEIALLIISSIEEAIADGYDRFYMNVDYLENGKGSLRVLVMKGPEYLIVYDEVSDLDICFQVLELLESSKYPIKNFTVVM